MQQPRHVQRHHTAAQRQEMLTAYQRSQLTQKGFAAQAGIGCSTLTSWLRKAARAQPPGAAVFVPVSNLFSAAALAPTYRLQLPRGLVLEVASAGWHGVKITPASAQQLEALIFVKINNILSKHA